MNEITDYKICSKCKISKPRDEFTKSQYENNSGVCKACIKEYNKQYREKNKDELREKRQEYVAENKDKVKQQRKKSYEANKAKNKGKILAQGKKHYEKNKKTILIRHKKYKQENKEHIKKKNREYEKNRLQNDPEFSLRKRMSATIRRELKKNGSIKNRISISQYFSDTYFSDLRLHIEAQFSAPENLHNGKVWMTWDNHGKYDPKTWDDNDPSTWTWQVDHIIPQSDFHFNSMDDKEFKDCYAIENQRPLSAKQNHSDGVKRTRHEKNDRQTKTHE